MPTSSGIRLDQKRDKARAPETHQMRKGKYWYLGMKPNPGLDSQSRLVHNAVVTALNVHDSTSCPTC